MRRTMRLSALYSLNQRRDTRTPQAIFMVLDVAKNSIYQLIVVVVEYFYDTKLCLPHLPR